LNFGKRKNFLPRLSFKSFSLKRCAAQEQWCRERVVGGEQEDNTYSNKKSTVNA